MPQRVVAMVRDGLYQRYLVSRLADEFGLAGIVVHAPLNIGRSLRSIAARYGNPVTLIRHLRARRSMRAYGRRRDPSSSRCASIADRHRLSTRSTATFPPMLRYVFSISRWRPPSPRVASSATRT